MIAAQDLPSPCPACGRTTATTGRGRCVNCAHVKEHRPTAADLAPRETWPGLLHLASRKALRAALLALPLAVLAGLALTALAIDLLAACALGIVLLVLVAVLGAAVG